ncbi:S8 family serine peptidase [Ramlibacter albus]|uniref:S8 family serine peptidase n=1 Tax=Ramlibacter albus TaxID=2079448 RepID=A0A923S5K8_9BURK|nr:S8 family serine peptidase [Ramlibacter albus]MBC5768098.1 S8 family serine peptidase [Ramlibacter albus]
MRNGLSSPARIGALVIGAVLATFNAAQAASHDTKEITALEREAAARKYVRVMMDLGLDVPLQSPDKHSAALRAALLAREDALLEELGTEVLRSTVWRNGLGQIGLHVTAKGLKTLAATRNAASFTRDPTNDLRASVYRADGRLSKIEAEIQQRGFADVEVAQNLDNFEFDVAPDGRVAHRPDRAQAAEIAAKRASMLGRLPDSGVLDLAAAKARAASQGSPMFHLRINMEGLLALIEHDDVRGLRLASSNEVEPPILDPAALEAARKHGAVRVAIVVYLDADLAPALGLTWQMGLSNVTVNMSLRSFKQFTGPCDGAVFGWSYADSIARLTSMTVPVVSITGNEGFRDRITFPGCLSGVIKVGSTDDASGQLSWFSNMADPALFGGYFLMAPGDPITSSTSYAAGDVAYPYGSMSGTSMAAPHVAGLFAMVKAQVPGAPVANIAAYLFSTGAPISGPYGTGLRRVRLPNF